MPLKCPFCGHSRIIVRQTVSYAEEYEYNTGDSEWQQNSNEWNFETHRVYCKDCKAEFRDIEEVERAQETTFEQFKQAYEKRIKKELGQHEEALTTDIKELYKDFLSNEDTLDDYLKHV